MSGLLKKEPKAALAPDTTPVASPNLASPQPQQEDFPSPGGSNSFVSSWSRSVSQAGATSPPPPAMPTSKSKFSFFSSKPVAPSPTPTTPAAVEEEQVELAPEVPVKEGAPEVPEKEGTPVEPVSRSSLSSPPPASIPETAEETQPSSVVSVDGEETGEREEMLEKEEQSPVVEAEGVKAEEEAKQ